MRIQAFNFTEDANTIFIYGIHTHTHMHDYNKGIQILIKNKDAGSV